MAHIVAEPCFDCKFTDCVVVCPVDCFYEGENMLVIHPDECIDCGVCETECPVNGHQARFRGRLRAVVADQRAIFAVMAKYNDQEVPSAGRK